MRICTPKYFNEFVCSNTECTDTCCKHWRVELDDDTYMHYIDSIHQSTKLGLTLKKHICKGKSFKNCKDGSCPFLNENQLCSLHLDFGYDVLPYTCKAFPRFYNSFGMYEEAGLSFSCPTAAKLICTGEGELITYEDDRELESYTNVDASLFYSIKKARDKIYTFLNRSDLSLNLKISSILRYSIEIQQLIFKKQYFDISSVELSVYNKEFDFEDIRTKAIKKLLRFNILRSEWKDCLIASLTNGFVLSDVEGTIWLKYFIYRYLMNSANDREFLPKINGALYSLAVIGSLGLPFEVAAQRFSKEIEHNESNIRKILKIKKIF